MESEVRGLARATWGFLAWPYATTAVAGFGLALRLGTLALLGRYPLVSDAAAYHQVALQYRYGEVFLPFWPPGLPLYLALVYGLLGGSEIVGRAAMLPFYLITSGCLFALVREIGDRRAANLALVLFAIYPSSVHLSIEPLTQMPVAVGVTACAWLTLRLCRSQRMMRAALAIVLGSLLAWSSLVRANSLALIPFVSACTALCTRRLEVAVVPALVAGLLTGGWITHTHQQTGEWVPISYNGAFNMFLGNNAHTPLYRVWWLGSHGVGEPGVPAEFSALRAAIGGQPLPVQYRLYRELALDHITSRPDLFAIRTLSRIRVFFALDTYSGAMILRNYRLAPVLGYAVLVLDAALYLALASLALACLFNAHLFGLRRGHVAILLGIALSYASPYALAISHPTYRFPILTIFGGLAAVALATLLTRLKEYRPAMLPGLLRQQTALLVALLVLALIQAEWILAMADRL